MIVAITAELRGGVKSSERFLKGPGDYIDSCLKRLSGDNQMVIAILTGQGFLGVEDAGKGNPLADNSNRK